MSTQRITLSEWLPDTPSTGTGLQDLNNTVPLITGYAPLRTAQQYSLSASENLNNVFAGKFGANIELFAGGSTELFKLDSGSLALNSVSKVGDYSSVSRWNFVQFGQTVIAANSANTVQYWTIGSSTQFQDLGTFFSGTYARASTGDIAITTTSNHGLTIGNSYKFYFSTGTAAEITTTVKNATISNVARTSNVVTVTTASIHGYAVGHTVTVAATTNTSINGTFTVTGTPTTTTFTYAQTASNITSVADTGSVYNPKAFNITNGTGATSGNVSIYTSNAPVAKYIATIRDFVVAAHLDNGSNANKLQWSDINNELNWNSGNASQSDFQIISDGGNITGITGGEFGIVLLEKAIYRMSYVGSPYFFQFDAIARGMGCIAGGSVAQFAGITYFLSDDGFYSCDGRTVTPIGIGKVDKFLFNSISLNDIDSMSCAVDPENKIIVWNYKNTSGNRSLIIYNFVSQKWSKADTDAEYVAPIATTGVSIDSLDSAYNINAGSFVNGKSYTIRTVGSTNFMAIGAVANTIGVLFTATGAGSGTGVAIDMAAATIGLKTIDTIVASLDDRSFIGGKYLFAGVASNYIVIFSGDYSTATFTTGDIEVGYNSVMQLARPQVQNGSATIASSSRRNLNDDVTFSSDIATSNEGRVSLRSAGRYHRVRITPTGNWTIAIALDVDFADQGSR
jgi:hypothetical protein